MANELTFTQRIFSDLDGKKSTVDGLTGVFKYETWDAIYPYAHTVHKMSFVPDAKAKRTEEYRFMRETLGDDFIIDMTNSETIAEYWVKLRTVGTGV